MAGSIVDLSRSDPGREVRAEICIIGSGPGGATAAWELAQAGHDVIVLEEGGDFTGSELTQREGEMYDQLYMDRGGRTTSDMAITVMQGRTLGGGSVINACDVVPIHDGVLRCWQHKYGLTHFSPETIEPYRRRALDDLAASLPTEEQFNRNNLLLRAGSQALGWRGEVMLHNRAGCRGTGVCLIGCPVNAKRNARFVAIPAALAAGARFFTRARAVAIEGATGMTKTVRVRRLDRRGYHEHDEFRLRADIVILAANAIGSAQLLLRSGIGNEHVGRHLSLQPQLPLTAVFADDVRSFRGIPQIYAVTEFEDLDNTEHGWWGFRIESIAGTPGVTAGNLPVFGAAGRELMRQYPYTASALLLTPDENVGHVAVDANGRLRIHYSMTNENQQRLRQAVRVGAQLYFAAGAREVFVPTVPGLRLRSPAELDAVDGLQLRPATAPLISAHQQGTVRMAPSPRDGAADPEGKVYGARGIYVFDSSGFPTSSSSHTMTPILTVSRYLAQSLAARLS